MNPLIFPGELGCRLVGCLIDYFSESVEQRPQAGFGHVGDEAEPHASSTEQGVWPYRVEAGADL